MDENSRRSLHELIARALGKDAQAAAAVEEMVVGFDRAGAVEDVAQSLEALLTAGAAELHERILTRLQHNDHQNRQQWPMIG